MLLAWQRLCDKRLNEGRTETFRLATQQLPGFIQRLPLSLGDSVLRHQHHTIHSFRLA